MKKVFFKFNDGNQLQLVKGCPTDIRDYNGDGNIDQDDQDYYDGYMDGYNEVDDNLDHSEAYYMGHGDGFDDYKDDIISGHNTPGPDIGNDDFVAIGAYYL